MHTLQIDGSDKPVSFDDTGPLYSSFDAEIGNADGDGRAAVRCVWRAFPFRVGLSDGSMVVKEEGCGGFVFLVCWCFKGVVGCGRNCCFRWVAKAS